jgi:predicted GTPase
MAALTNAAGADFVLKGPRGVQLDARKPVISVCAVRTGCGKSGLTRYIGGWLKEKGLTVAAIRHPMAYRDLLAQKAQRFASLEDVQECTIEEREEFEPLIRAGIPVYCGVDYQAVIDLLSLDKPQIVIWDGGNNDFSFLKSDLKITVVDPLRWEDTERYYPGEMNLIDADVVVINKVNTAPDKNIAALEEIIEYQNPGAKIVYASSDVDQDIDFEEELKGKKVCVVEDGPTLTHGDMPFGIGCLVVSNYTSKNQIVDVVPAIGYNDEQLQELEERINECDADIVLATNQVDLPSILNINKPVLQITYSNYFDDDKFEKILMEFFRKGAVKTYFNVGA